VYVLQTDLTTKAKSFFEYLLALNNLIGKVTRDFSEFEKSWLVEELIKINGVFILDQCNNEENILEIHRPPNITKEEETPPKLNNIILDWLNFNYFNENAKPSYIKEKSFTDLDGGEIIEQFADDTERSAAYSEWISEWTDWSEQLKEKKQVLKLYEEFFYLISKLEKEGESLEFIFGSGLFYWKHPDNNVGTIRSPLLTTKLELEIDAEKGIISAKLVDKNIKFEREIFSGVRIPNIEQINELISSIQTKEITDDLSDFFNQFIHLLDANGEYFEESTLIKLSEEPSIYNQSMFFLRKKNIRVLRDDLEQIISGLSKEELKIPDAIVSILGESNNKEDIKSSNTKNEIENFTENELYFPLDSNEQQKEIVNRIERNYGVTVQGPPGTGKTHTIANIVSHFLSEGKKILITSQKESPLKVLKDKIPKEIRDLCVPVLGGGRESLKEIEQSIRVIGEKLGELDTHRLAVNIKRDKEELNKSKRFEAQLKNKLKVYAEKEGTELHYKGEKLFKYDVAKRLSESEIDYSWIHDNIPIEENFPLPSIEFKELWDLKNNLSKEKIRLREQILPVVDIDILNSNSFSAFLERGRHYAPYDSEGQEVLGKYELPRDKSLLKYLSKDTTNILNMTTVLENSNYKLIIEDCKAGGVREQRWHELLNKMIAANKSLFELHNSLVTHKIDLPDRDITLLNEEVGIVKERLESGKKINFLFFMGKGKKVKYLLEDSILDGRPISTLDHVKTLESYLEFLGIKKEITRIFNGNMEDIGLPVIDENDRRFQYILEDRINELTLIFKAIETVQVLIEKMKSFNIKEINFYSVEKVKELDQQLECAINHLLYQEWLKEYENKLKILQKFSQQELCHPIVQEFIAAYKEKSNTKWVQTLCSLQELYELKETVNRFYQLLDMVKNIMPLTSKGMELTVGIEQKFPENYSEAFELRKLQTWLDETKDVNIGLIKQQINEEHHIQRNLIKNIVSNATWKNQIEKISDEEKRSLSAWKSYINRYGAGKGKYAHKYLQDARKEMKKAQSAIPVWIMPINQVLENFPVTNEKFDIVIFDESSQCDLFSINVLLRGKKIIVVGDDEQISPQAIGTNLEDVHELVRRHLAGIPNASLFDGNISLYEIAEQTFPKEGKLMLREHFRCVPEIIQFSNDLSYGGEMIPLRLPLEEEKIDPPVIAIKVTDGYNDERENDINIPEIEAIVKDMVEMISNPIYDGQTFGVITLQGQKQHKLLETKIREGIGDSEFVNRKIICGNAYTLQGDERDIIFLSMVVAPNRRFRAFTKSSEKQRFNVAASRAKNQMRLYYSVDLENLSQDDFRYSLLSYCKNPSRVNYEGENLEDKCESPFEVDVLKMILAKGYKVTPQVEVGRYRIDLVVEGLRDRLAVECDGEKWHGPEKYEEDMLRQESLERAGWKFWRVRGGNFYFDRVKAMESLWNRLEQMGIEKRLKEQQINTITSKPTYKSEIEKKKSKTQSQTINLTNIKTKQMFSPVQTELFDSSHQINLFDETD